MSESDSTYYTQAEACAHLNIKRWSLWRFAKDGRLHPLKSNRDQRRNVYLVKEVDTLATARIPVRKETQ